MKMVDATTGRPDRAYMAKVTTSVIVGMVLLTAWFKARTDPRLACLRNSSSRWPCTSRKKKPSHAAALSRLMLPMDSVVFLILASRLSISRTLSRLSARSVRALRGIVVRRTATPYRTDGPRYRYSNET